MAKTTRPPLDAETLQTLAQNAHLALDEQEFLALLPPTAAIFVAVDALDALPGLATAEPAAHFALEG